MKVEFSPKAGLYFAFPLEELDIGESVLVAIIERYREEGNDVRAAEDILSVIQGVPPSFN